jgi:hypothetical protein
MTRWQRTLIIGLAGAAGAGLGYAAGGGARDQGWLLGLVGLIGGMFLAGKVLSLIWQVGDLADRRRSLSRRMDETDPSPERFVAGGSTEATIARFAAMDPLVPELVPDELAALPKMLDPSETMGGLTGATRNGKPGLLAVTDRRLVFVAKGQPGHAEIEIPLEHVTGVRSTPSSVLGQLVIIASGHEEGFKMANQQLERFSQFLEVRIHHALGGRSAS